MLSNHLKIAVRNLLKHKVFSAINIFGLSVGIACCVLLSLYIKDEFSYEQHFKDHDRVYRLYTNFTKDGVTDSFSRTSIPIAMQLPNLLPEVEIGTRVISPPEVEQHLIKYGDRLYYEEKGYLVDSTFFDIFDYAFKEGDQRTALDQPSTVVLSDRVARKIFGDQSPLDELVIINSGPAKDTFRITGVLQPYSNPSHLNADFYMCMNSKGWGEYISEITSWAWENFAASYVRLYPNASAASVDSKMPELINKYAGEDLRTNGMIKEIHFQPLDDIRLYSNFSNNFGFENNGAGNITYVYILASIGIFILLIACINFMNLTTAKAAQRAGEVGVRKSLGANRQNLISQFLGESMAIVTVSMILSLIILVISMPSFNYLTHKDLTLWGENFAYVIAALFGIALITGLLAGSYPAFFLSSFQPAKVLKDKRLSGGASWLRKGLVVFQFIIAITLISSIVIIREQLGYIQSMPLGFSTDHNVVVPLRTKDARTSYMQLKNEFKRIAGVKEVSATTSLPSTALLRDYALYIEGSSMEKGILHKMIFVDEGYIDLMKIHLLAGRNFIYETDSFSNSNPRNKVIVNQASLKEYGLTLDNAIGTQLLSEYDDKIVYHEIIGVVEDFHQASLHEKISPYMMKIPNNHDSYGFVTLTLAGGSGRNALDQMENAWKQLVPGTPFESFFLEDNVKKQYEADDRVSMIITIFTVLAIVISCLGLYGLSIYMAERRVKEIGIRKVLGASVSGIVSMLSMDFLKLVGIAFLIAVPLGYYTMT